MMMRSIILPFTDAGLVRDHAALTVTTLSARVMLNLHITPSTTGRSAARQK